MNKNTHTKTEHQLIKTQKAKHEWKHKKGEHE